MEKKNYGGERLTDEDLLTEVLSRLDVKSLLRSKAVSKTWCSLISSPSFIKSHSQRAILSCCKDDGTLIVHHYVKKDRITEHFSLVQLNSGQDVLPDLGYPYSQGEYSVLPECLPECKLIGCHFGIVAVCVTVLVYDNPRDWDTARNQTDIYLWNPATKQSKLIPKQDNLPQETAGFGFDDISNEFKVVRVTIGHRDRLNVYSANSNTWRIIEHTIRDGSSLIFEVNLHGVLFCRNYSFMVAFDLNREQLGCRIKIPDAPGDFNVIDSCITDFKGSIAVITPVNGGLFCEKFDLRTLNNNACLFDSEVEASWNVMFRINVGMPVYHIEGHFNRADFLCLIDKQGRFVYNSEKKLATHIPTDIMLTEVFKYTESLISIAGSKPVNWTAS